jgi:hypothetical protein
MPCTLNSGRTEPCKDVVGGITAVYFLDFGNVATVDSSTDAITDFAASTSTYKYEVKGNSSLTQNINSSRENGTTFFEQVLSLTLHKMSAADNKEIKLLAYGRPHIIVEDNNGDFYVMGREYGADVTGGTVVTGAAMGDLSGYTLTFTAMEKMPANYAPLDLTLGVDPAPDTLSIAGGTASLSIVYGTNS